MNPYVAVLLLGLSLSPTQPAPDLAPVAATVTPGAVDSSPFAHVVFGPPSSALEELQPTVSENAIEADAARSAGQDKADEKKPPTPAHTGVHALLAGVWGDFKHLPTKDNAYIAVAGGAAALAVHPFDESLNAHLRSHYDLVNTIYTPAKWIGESPVQVGAAIVVYVLGRVNDQPKVSHFGMDLIRGLIVNEVITDVLKVATQRERPDHSDSLSFPSGHASTTFTTATIIERHLGWKYAALGYTLASYVASSRLHDNRHWLSDVVFGAAVGTISGRTVTQHGRNVWTLAPAAVPGGAAIVVARTGR